MLSDDPARHFDIGMLERYIAATGDTTPILYLAARYCGNAQAAQDAALAEIRSLAEKLPVLLASIAGGEK
jgi:hypothetical protein